MKNIKRSFLFYYQSLWLYSFSFPLMACDGWYAAVRYINLDHAYWTDYEGTFFHE